MSRHCPTRAAPSSVTLSRTERPSATARPLASRPSAASWLTIVLTLFGASRSSCAASATLIPGLRAVSRSSSDLAGGSAPASADELRARRATRRIAPSVASSSAAAVLAVSLTATLTSFTELTI